MQFHVYPDGARLGRFGSSWHTRSSVSKFTSRVLGHGNLAAAMSKNWEYILYIIVGKMAIPRWESMSTPSARQLHGQVIDELKNYTKQVVLIDDFLDWRAHPVRRV